MEKNEAVTSFIDHGGDVMSLSVLPSVNRNVFISGSCDATAKVRGAAFVLLTSCHDPWLAAAGT